MTTAPNRLDWLMLAVLGLIWGGSFLGVSVALEGFGPAEPQHPHRQKDLATLLRLRHLHKRLAFLASELGTTICHIRVCGHHNGRGSALRFTARLAHSQRIHDAAKSLWLPVGLHRSRRPDRPLRLGRTGNRDRKYMAGPRLPRYFPNSHRDLIAGEGHQLSWPDLPEPCELPGSGLGRDLRNRISGRDPTAQLRHSTSIDPGRTGNRTSKGQTVSALKRSP